MLARLFAAALAVLPFSAHAQQLDEGWWVVVGSFPDNGEAMTAGTERVSQAAARCGFTTFSDFSAKFSGFAPGFHVFVIGAYPRRSDADAVRRLVRPCIPDAYLKRGRYAGE